MLKGTFISQCMAFEEKRQQSKLNIEIQLDGVHVISYTDVHW